MPQWTIRGVETSEPLADGVGRSPARWVVPVLALLAALVVALLAVVTNLATAAVPVGWTWVRDGRVLWPTVAVLTVLSGVLAWRAARVSGANQGGSPSGLAVTAGAGSPVATGGGPAMGAVSAGGGSVVIVGPGGPVTVSVPQPAPAARPGRLVVGELPGEPPSFQHRRALSELVEVFAEGGRVAVVCAVTGARGVGKTQIAAAYARQQVVTGCPLVGWVSGESTIALVAGLAEVARALGVADPEGDSMVSARRLRAHLESRDEPALLVVDNAVDADALRRLLPAVGPTQVIITSTDHASFAHLGAAVEVSVFDRVQSLAYLRARTRRTEGERDADRVAGELGDLPLALAQAASVIVLQRLSYTDYLARLQTLPTTRMLPRGTGDPYPKGTAEAIVLSVQAAVDADPAQLADRVLPVIAVLSPSGAQRSVLHHIVTTTAANQDDVTTDAAAARVDDVLARLVGLSLLAWDESGTSVIAHRLVARVIRDRARAAGTLASTIGDTARVLDQLRIPEQQAWSAREHGRELVDHALALWEAALDLVGDRVLTTQDLAVYASLMNWAVQHLVAVADLSRAVHTGGQVLTDCERVLGADHPATLASRNNLAGAYRAAGVDRRSG